jgi:hypothetical protein
MRQWFPASGQWVSRALAALAAIGVAALAFGAYGWPGLGLALGVLVMWALLHMSRMLMVLRRTAQNPVGSVASAVMLHARLVRGMPLLQVLALTHALGQSVSEPDSEPVQYQWTDASLATVRCSFANGKLVQWDLLRP